jgi:hypothetical protein
MTDLLDFIIMYRWPRRIFFAAVAGAIAVWRHTDERLLFALAVVVVVAITCEVLDRVFGQ